MYQSVQRFYSRKAITFREILLSSSMDREPMILLEPGNEKVYDQCMKDLAFENWIFTTLPANNPSANWPLSLPEFYGRFQNLRPLALWAEPFDESYNFQEAAYNYLIKSIESQTPNKDSIKLGLLSLLDVTLGSGSYERIV